MQKQFVSVSFLCRKQRHKYWIILIVYDSQAGINGWQCLMQCLVEKNLETTERSRRLETLLQAHKSNAEAKSLQWAAQIKLGLRSVGDPPWGSERMRENWLQILGATTSRNTTGKVNLYLGSFYLCLVSPSPLGGGVSIHDAYLPSSHLYQERESSFEC